MRLLIDQLVIDASTFFILWGVREGEKASFANSIVHLILRDISESDSAIIIVKYCNNVIEEDTSLIPCQHKSSKSSYRKIHEPTPINLRIQLATPGCAEYWTGIQSSHYQWSSCQAQNPVDSNEDCAHRGQSRYSVVSPEGKRISALSWDLAVTRG